MHIATKQEHRRALDEAQQPPSPPEAASEASFILW